VKVNWQPGPWERARRIAAEALSGYVYEPVGLATHYHTTAIHPWWADALTKAVTIGNHIFYRWRGEWGDPKSFRRPYVGAEAYAAWRSSQPADGAAPAEAPTPEIVFGVAVHREGADANPAQTALETQAGVRVHRAGTRRAAAVEVAAADAPAAVEGVRVHHGSDAAEPAAAPGATR
jgi:hypothetical protein